MYIRPSHNKTSSISISSENSSSSSISSSTAKICRICHVVESKRRGDKVFLAGMEKNKCKSFSNNFFKQMISSLVSSTEDESATKFNEEELIAPCECRGTMRHVHRECLNQWRTASPRSDSFTRCEQCFASYKFKNTWITSFFTHPTTIYSVCLVLFVSWMAASSFVSTGAINGSEHFDLFNLLPILKLSRNQVLPNQFLSELLLNYNNFMSSANRLFYGLIFVALTEYIFFTPSFLLSFNTLFCIWRIQRYDIFWDKWLLVAFTVFGIWRAWKSLHGMIRDSASRIVKLKLLEVLDRDKIEEK